MLGYRPTDNPVMSNHKLDGEKYDMSINRERYQWLVGKLIYLSHARLNIAYAVNVMRQFMHDPKEIHIEAVFRILRYLKSTLCKGIQFQKAEGMTYRSKINL